MDSEIGRGRMGVVYVARVGVTGDGVHLPTPASPVTFKGMDFEGQTTGEEMKEVMM